MRRSRHKLSGQSSARPLVMLAAFALAMLAVWWLAISPPARQEPAPSAPTENAAAPEALAPAEPSQPVEQPPPLTAKQKSASPAAALQAEEATPANTPVLGVAAPMRQGPLDELSKRFAGESRGASSDTEDARVRAAFTDAAIPPGMLHNAECRRSVCRVELGWTAQHDAAYVLGLTRAVGSLSAPLGIEAAGAPDKDGVQPVVVYFGLTH